MPIARGGGGVIILNGPRLETDAPPNQPQESYDEFGNPYTAITHPHIEFDSTTGPIPNTDNPEGTKALIYFILALAVLFILIVVRVVRFVI